MGDKLGAEGRARGAWPESGDCSGDVAHLQVEHAGGRGVGDVLAESDLVESCRRGLVRLGRGRPQWIVCCAGVP